MGDYNEMWLPHLKNAIPKEAYSHQINMYTIALEGWRRGLGLKFFKYIKNNKLQIKYALSFGQKEYIFEGSRGSLISKETINICIRKDLTKERLKEYKIPVPEGRSFNDKNSEQEIIEYSKELGFPLVIKPRDGSLGKGVITNINNIDQLKQSLKYLREDLGYTNIIVEKYIMGKDIRVYVIDGKIGGAVYRIPANIVGNGRDTISKLIEEKNNSRKSNPNLSRRSIKLDRHIFEKLKVEGLTLNSVLPKNKRLFLRNVSNISAGGDPIDITDELTPKIKEMAIRAAQAVGAKHCGVDILLNTKENTGAVIEINSKAHIGSHLFPLKGKARDIPKAILDLYFPETKDQGRIADNIFFDLETITKPLVTGTAEVVKLPKAPKIEHVTSFIVYCNGNSRIYRRWIQRRAIALNLNGHLDIISKKRLRVVVGGDEEQVYNFKSILLNDSPNRFNVKEVKEKKWKNPIPLGFVINEKNKFNELKDLYKSLNETEEEKINLIDEINKLSKENEVEKEILLQEIDLLKKNYNNLIQSRSWKVTLPLRKIRKALRKIKV